MRKERSSVGLKPRPAATAWRHALADARALGWSAPTRAAYELSKRSGMHAVLFGAAAARGHRSVPIGLGAVVPESPEAAERCLEDARRIVQEGSRVFGRRVATGGVGSWSRDPLSGLDWPQTVPWWSIDIRSDDRLSDVKWVWEAGRHRDLVVLARAARLEPESTWLAELVSRLEEWLEQCPPERGIHWYSSLELALRAIAWAQVFELVRDRLPPETVAAMDDQLLASARHITVELPYTASSMKNNHLLGDGLGLHVLGRMFPTHPAARRWRRLGDVLFHRQLARHMHPDGSMIEDSLSYHRFVLEMLAVRVLLGDASSRVRDALLGSAQLLRTLGCLSGPVPQYGDWDEGRVLADSATPGDVAGSTWLGLALSGKDVDPSLWTAFDELAWYVAPAGAPGEPLEPLPAVRTAGYFQVVERGRWKVWFKCGSGPSHQHADLTALWVHDGETWLIEDPGTGTYNGPLAVRNGFRTSSAHPVWRPAGEDQLVPHRAFRWLRSPSVQTMTPLDLGTCVLLLAGHDAFGAGAGVARLVVVAGDGVRVHDFLESCTPAWEMSLPLGLGAGQHPRFETGEVPVVVKGSEDPFGGWHSPTYGDWQPATWQLVEASAEHVVWTLGQPPPVGASAVWSAEAVRVRVTDRADLTVEIGRA